MNRNLKAIKYNIVAQKEHISYPYGIMIYVLLNNTNSKFFPNTSECIWFYPI